MVDFKNLKIPELNKSILEIADEDLKYSIQGDFFQIQEFQTKINLLYHKHDIRKSYFDYAEQILFCYALSIHQLKGDDLEDQIKRMYRLTNREIKEEVIIERIRCQLNQINANLIIRSWSNFEFCIDTICAHIFSKEKKEEMMNKRFDNILKCLKKITVLESDKIENCLKSLKVSSFHLIDSLAKIKQLLSHLEASWDAKTYHEYIDFIDNFSRLRNTMHSNFIFHGKKEESYPFQGVDYIYKPGEPLRMVPLQTEDATLKLSRKLMFIFFDIVNKLHYLKFIKDPIVL